MFSSAKTKVCVDEYGAVNGPISLSDCGVVDQACDPGYKEFYRQCLQEYYHRHPNDIDLDEKDFCKEAKEKFLGLEQPLQKEFAKLEKNGMGPKVAVKRPFKDPNAPKRPKTAFIFFSMEERKRIQATEKLTFEEYAKVVGDNWNKLEDKTKYKELAEEDRGRYLKEMETYKPPPELQHVKQRVMRVVDQKAPRAPLTPFDMYHLEVSRRLEKNDPSLKLQLKKVRDIVQAQWDLMDESDREVYHERAEVDNALHKEEEKYRKETKNKFANLEEPLQEDVDELDKYESTPKAKKPPKDPNAPKRPRTAYIFFSVEESKRLHDVKKLPFAKCTKVVAENWNNLEDKSKYHELAKKDRERYSKEMEAYKPPSELKPIPRLERPIRF